MPLAGLAFPDNRNHRTSVLPLENRSLISLSTFVGEDRSLDTLLT
jgi:hypothetical protein